MAELDDITGSANISNLTDRLFFLFNGLRADRNYELQDLVKSMFHEFYYKYNCAELGS